MSYMKEYEKWLTSGVLTDEDKQAIVRKAVPQNISEAEPKDVSKK